MSSLLNLKMTKTSSQTGFRISNFHAFCKSYLLCFQCPLDPTTYSPESLRWALSRHLPFRTAQGAQPTGSRLPFSFFSRPPRSKPRIETKLRSMEPEPARSPRPQQDPARPHAPTMPPPETPSEGRQPSPSHSPTEVLLG
ncbi:hypothetical protein H8959_015423 [Pygathrix nigripes]